MSKLNEILGVEEGQEFTFKSELTPYFKYKIEKGRRYSFDGSSWFLMGNEDLLTEMINHPERIKILPIKPKLTEQQITAIRGRIAEGWRYIAKDSTGTTAFYLVEPQFNTVHKIFTTTGSYSVVNFPIYDFLKSCQCFYLPDLIKEEEK